MVIFKHSQLSISPPSSSSVSSFRQRNTFLQKRWTWPILSSECIHVILTSEQSEFLSESIKSYGKLLSLNSAMFISLLGPKKEDSILNMQRHFRFNFGPIINIPLIFIDTN